MRFLDFFRKKEKRPLGRTKQLLADELARRDREKQEKLKAHKAAEKIRLKWQKQHKKEYIARLKKERPRFYWRWRITTTKLPFFLDLVRWVLIDIFRGKYLHEALWGVYIFVANPGEGKTLSMVKHIEEKRVKNPHMKVYTNFGYRGQNGAITCWQDIVRAPRNSIIGIDEAHLTFESNDFRNFPPEMLSQLSLNRKLRKQFICSTQRFDKLNKTFRDLANYVVVCKNHMNLDRFFSRHYYNNKNYAKHFDGKLSKSDFNRPFVAHDSLYHLYDTLGLIEKMVEEIDSIEVKESDLLPKLNELLAHNDLTDKEVKSVLMIRERILAEIEEFRLHQERTKFAEQLAELDINLRNDFQRLVTV